MRIVSTLLAGAAATVMFSCASSPSAEFGERPDGGLVEDHATAISNCGVGNYLFRYLKGNCATDPTSTAAAESGTSDANPVAEEQPVTETRSTRIAPDLSQAVTFETDSAILTDEGRTALDGIAKGLAGEESGKVVVEGHADHRGDATYNQRLSERRAAEVRNYLTSQGVSRDRIETKGYGEKLPEVEGTNLSDEELRANRRVEFKTAESE